MITKREIIKALKVMGKNKAQSIDGLTDNIFQESTWSMINFLDNTWEERMNDQRDEELINAVRNKMAVRLAAYLNHTIQNEDKLPFD